MEIGNFKGEVRRNELLSMHTTYAIGGPADILAYPSDIDDLRSLLQAASVQGVKHFILGGGSNILVRDGGFRGIVVSLQRMNAVRIDREFRAVGGSYILIFAAAGAPLAKVLAFSGEKGATGFEFAAGIPGTVGGAVCMNAGTALGEIGDVIESVTLLSPGGELVIKTGEEMGFGYRTSRVPPEHVILDVRIKLRRDDAAKIQARIKELLAARKERQPWGQASAGSVFKNPLDESAGMLIEKAGLKGRTIGNAQVSPLHANFIVNLGKAKAADVIALMEVVKQRVLEVHRVQLEPEIKIIGED